MSRPARLLAALPFLEPPPIPYLRYISTWFHPSGLVPHPILLLCRIGVKAMEPRPGRARPRLCYSAAGWLSEAGYRWPNWSCGKATHEAGGEAERG